MSGFGYHPIGSWNVTWGKCWNYGISTIRISGPCEG